MATVLVLDWGSNKKGRFLESTGIVDEMAISPRWWPTVAAACSFSGAVHKAKFEDRKTKTTKKSHEDKPKANGCKCQVCGKK